MPRANCRDRAYDGACGGGEDCGGEDETEIPDELDGGVASGSAGSGGYGSTTSIYAPAIVGLAGAEQPVSVLPHRAVPRLSAKRDMSTADHYGIAGQPSNAAWLMAEGSPPMLAIRIGEPSGPTTHHM